GSEMCIRDRVLVAVPSAAPDAAVRRALAVRELLAQAGMIDADDAAGQPQRDAEAAIADRRSDARAQRRPRLEP
ncbi:MAG TPA: hypothetical protein DCQ04_02590, partial [Actinobacteria bacterium]|nr:hypothetical protein [Actinomycetota bacterium]